MNYPYKLGDTVVVKVKITDVEKSFNFLGKAMLSEEDTTKLGITIDAMYPWENRFNQSIKNELKYSISNEITDILNKYLGETK